MTLYVKQLAWLNAVPTSNDKSGVNPKSRREQDPDTVMPPCPLPHVIQRLFEIGPTLQGSIIPLSEIVNWQALMQCVIAPWEVKLIRHLSGVYAAESHESRSPTRPAPWLKLTNKTREKVAKQIKSAFSGRTTKC